MAIGLRCFGRLADRIGNSVLLQSKFWVLLVVASVIGDDDVGALHFLVSREKGYQGPEPVEWRGKALAGKKGGWTVARCSSSSTNLGYCEEATAGLMEGSFEQKMLFWL